jgi:hypothetical protein
VRSGDKRIRGSRGSGGISLYTSAETDEIEKDARLGI